MDKYVEKFPINSFLLTGPRYFQDVIRTINIHDTLSMTFQSNEYDNSAIVIKKNGIACGHVPQNSKEKIARFVPSQVKVIDKRLADPYVWNLRVEVI